MAPTLRSNFIYIERGRARYISNFIYIELVSNFYLWPCKLSKRDTVKRKPSDETPRPGAARGEGRGRRVGAFLAAGDGPPRPAGRGGGEARRGGARRFCFSTGRHGSIGIGNLPSSIANSTSLIQRTLGFKKQCPQHVASPVP
jgi:hypothetical protein